MTAAAALAALKLPENAEAREAVDDIEAKPNMALADQLKRWIESDNIALDIDEAEGQRIANAVLRDYDIDEESRADWKEKYEKWLKFALQVTEAKTYPWPSASNVIYPMITTAAIQFAARAYPAIIKDRNVVKGSVIGPDDGVPVIDPRTKQPAAGPQGPVWQIPPGIKKQRADKIGQHMSWQLLDEQEEWEPQTDALLVTLPIVGTMFRKSYFDPSIQRNVSETVTALQVCVNYKAKSFDTAPRVTEILELYPHEVEERIRSGLYLEEDYGQDQDAGQDEDAKMTFLEQHRRWDLDDDGYPEPYIVTVSKESGKLARIKAAYDMDGVFFSSKDHRIRKIKPVPYYTKYGFIPNPDGGVYDIGFGHLLFPINEAVNSTLNQLFDAGHLANAGGGFIGSGLSMNTGAVRFQVGEYKPVNVSNGTIRDNVLPLPFPGPNPVLFSLLQFLIEAGKEVAAVKDVMVGDLPGDNTSGVATLAMIEQGLAVFSAIYKRIYRSLKQEFKKLFRLNRLYLPIETGYMLGTEWKQITRADYEEGAGVEPVSDPRMITDMQKLGRAQFLLQFKDDPWFNPRTIRLQMLDAAQFPNPEELLVQQPPANPEVTAKAAELQIRQQEVQIRAAHEQGDLDLRRGKDKASEIESLSRSILNLAQARKADEEVNQNWYGAQIESLRFQMELLNAQPSTGGSSPASVAGLTAAPAQGADPGAVPGVAAPSGHPPGVPVSPGLPGAA